MEPGRWQRDDLKTTLADADAPVRVHERLGAYQIMREIGRGGMGAVYLARRADETFEKQVAIKLLKRGTDTDEVLRRFRAEGQILARLEHPNIARLLDAGTTGDGLPYFVMEHIQGVPISQFCHENGLTSNQRIKLFLEVCEAIQFAHRNLIVHRDLKPGNILVTVEAQPKLLDFGIAKLLEAEGETVPLTIENRQRLTPGYASPEQVRGETITTVSDVYSLGALLHELLTGQSPHRFTTSTPSPTELQRVIAEQEIGRTDLPSDLDTILRTALRKEPERRYSGVTAFSDDLRRYLEGRPVHARPATFGYRVSKFIAGNKLGAAAAVLLLTSLLGGITATSWQARKADHRFNQVRKLARAVIFDYHDAIATLPGSTAVRERLVSDALEYLDKLAREAGDDRGLSRELATAYAKVAQVQGNTYYANLGDTEGALKSYRASLALRERLRAASPDEAEIQHETATSYEGLGDVLYSRDELRAGLEQYERARVLRDQLYRTQPENLSSTHALGLLCLKLGDIRGGEGFGSLGDADGAAASYQRGLEILEPLLAAHPEDQELRSDLATLLTHASLLAVYAVGDATGAMAMARRAIELKQQVVQANPNDQSSQSALLDGKTYLRYALAENNLLAEAIELTRGSIPEEEKLLAEDPQNNNFRRSVGVAHNTLGLDLLAAGAAAEAVEHHRLALALSEEALAVDRNNEESKSDLAFTLRHLGRAQAANGDYASAVVSLRQALAWRQATVAAASGNARAQEDISLLYHDLGNSLAQNNDPAGAGEAFAHAIPLAEALLREMPGHARRKKRLADVYLDSGRFHLQLVRTSGEEEHRRSAREHLRRSVVLWRELRDRNALTALNFPKLQQAEAALADCE